ncbi:MAG: C45 family autoproteolytic acyltransferase/hydrolase [Planctomycetota bacterium]|jgi:predicted choloylglycine hydrolase
MKPGDDRISFLKGTPFEIGFAQGKVLGGALEENIRRWVGGLERVAGLDQGKLASDSAAFLERIPRRFREEIEGLAAGSGLALRRLGEWFAADSCLPEGCSGLVCLIDGEAWVARNNDYWLPDMWGYTIVREVAGRIPTMTFGLQADVFTATGVNSERLWMHYNWLPANEPPSADSSAVECQVFLPEALETCRSIPEVERLLSQIPRRGGMNLFVMDGKTNEFALFECSPDGHRRVPVTGGYAAATNHAISAEAAAGGEGDPSRRRLERIRRLMGEDFPSAPPEDLMSILSDAAVAVGARGEDFGTVYSNVACPARGLTWFAYEGCPAPSAGKWREIQWPWLDG